MRIRPLPVVAVAGLAGLLGAPLAHAGGPTTFEEATALASREGKPLLLDFYTQW